MPEINWNLAKTDPVGEQARAYSYADKIRQNASRLQAGQQYATGDKGAAATTLAQGGDIEGAQGIEQGQQKSAEAAYAYYAKAIPVFRKIADEHAGDPDGGRGAVAQAFDQIAPEMSAVTGHNEQIISQMRQSLVADPKGTLDQAEAQLPVKYQTAGRDVIAIQGNKVTPVYQGQKDAPANYQWGPDGKTAIPITGGPADPKVVHALGQDRRDIVVNNPMPSQAAPPATYHLLTDAEKAANGLPKDGVYQMDGHGKIDRVAGNNSVRPIPAAALTGIQSNRNTLRKIDKAIELLQTPAGRNAVGFKGMLPDSLTQRIDPEGVDTRSYIADIGSQKLHDRSGAAVTISEAPRLMPFIPSGTDTAENAIKKLKNLRTEYQSNASDTETFYSPESGYMSVPEAIAAPGNGGWTVKRVK